jgi:hypothetical protein
MEQLSAYWLGPGLDDGERGSSVETLHFVTALVCNAEQHD